MNIQTPEFSMVVLIGPTSTGKTTFATAQFNQHEVISSDVCRAMVSDDPTNQSVTPDAFEILHAIADRRLKNRRLTVIDATSLQVKARKSLVNLARSHDCPITALVFDLPHALIYARNQAREDRNIPNRVVRNQIDTLRRSTRNLRKEGFRRTFFIKSQEDADNAVITRTPMRSNQTQDNGPFDIIGDVHGCHQELQTLLQKLGYTVSHDEQGANAAHPDGRKAVFVGDLVDRGPGVDQVLELVMNMTQSGNAHCVLGNHEDKLIRTLKGNPTKMTHGLAQTMEQLESRGDEFKQRTADYLRKLPTHLMLDGHKLAVAHAGILKEYQGRHSRRVEQFCMYGETTGETDEWGLPVRLNWAQNYRGSAMVVYGHTPVVKADWFNGTINVDTGCVFGGKLTALRYPENEIVSVDALETYYEPAKPIDASNNKPDFPKNDDHLPLIEDVLEQRHVNTKLRGNISVRPEQAQSALETVSRFSVDARWLAYVPPTISPSESSQREDFLEHPQETFEYFRQNDVTQVICEEKHMGSRAIVVAGRDPAAIQTTFGINDENAAICYTRTGRNLFTGPDVELAPEFYQRVRAAIADAHLWEELETDWLILDCELMPWSFKAKELMRFQYAATATAADNTMGLINQALAQLAQRSIPATELEANFAQRTDATSRFRTAYRNYCWTVDSLDDLKLAPFHIMASKGAVHTNQPHTWHMELADRLAQADPRLFRSTQYRVVDLQQDHQVEAATNWWLEMTAAGGEGMVVKPNSFIAQSPRTMVQPAIKCRGPEYLRIIYGPEYNLPQNIDKVRRRSLHGKQALALREFALGVEGLDRLVQGKPLHEIHQCAFAVLALETESTDPRL